MVHHVISFPRDTIHLDVHAFGQYLYWPTKCTNFLQESSSPHQLLMGEPLKILQVTKSSNFINFFYAKAHHHLLDVGDSVLSFFFVFFVSFFFFQVAHSAVLLLESWLESLFGMRGATMHHVPGFLAIEAFAFFGKLVSFFRCKLLEASVNGIGLHFCSIYVHRNILWFPFLT